MEIAGKSSSEDEPQGAAFSGADSLMGTLSDPVNTLIYTCLYTILFNPLLNTLPFFFFHPMSP